MSHGQEQQSLELLRGKINALPWHHQIDFGGGLLTPGAGKIDVMMAQADVYFQGGITGQTFLDIGCWDGFNSFEAHKRGASRVLATDHFAWSEKCWGKREAFELARSHIAPSVEVMDIDLPDLTAERVGIFDVVLFAGVFYHLRHPFLTLETVCKLARRTFILETHLDALEQDRPMMVFLSRSGIGQRSDELLGSQSTLRRRHASRCWIFAGRISAASDLSKSGGVPRPQRLSTRMIYSVGGGSRTVIVTEAIRPLGLNRTDEAARNRLY
jgi:tRNA (mo5U34)-methyltransferase